MLKNPGTDFASIPGFMPLNARFWSFLRKDEEGRRFLADLWKKTECQRLNFKPPESPHFRTAADKQKECKVEEGNLMPGHVHMLLSVPPKYSVASMMGFIKGKSAIHLARVYAGRRRNYVGQHSWARVYWVSTV